MIKRSIAISVVVALGISQAQAVSMEAYRRYARGLIAARSGDASSAIEELRRVVALDPKAAAAYKDLAALRWQTGDPSGALNAVDELSRKNADDLDTQMFLGNFYLMAGLPEKARAAWEAALRIDPNNEAAMLYLATYHASTEAPGKAVQYWRAYVKRQPASAEAFYQLGIVLQKTGQSPAALQAFKRSAELKPDSADAHLAVAQLLEQEDRLPEAVASFRRYLDLVPDNVTAIMYLGGLLFRMKEYPAAAELFTRAKQLAPTDTGIDFWMGVLAEERKDWPTAIRHFEAVRAASETSMVLVRLSYYYSAVRKFRPAIRYLERVREREPRNPNVYYLLGLAYLDRRDFRKADRHFAEAVTRRPDLAEAHFHRGIMFDQWGKFDQAIVEIQKVIEINPRHAPALNYLGYSFVDRGMRLGEAEGLIRRALAVEPESGPYRDSLGWLYFKQGRFADAAAELSRAAAAYPDPIIFEHWGDALSASGDPTGAWDAYRSALDRAPRNKAVRSKMARLEKRLPSGVREKRLMAHAAVRQARLTSMRAVVSCAIDDHGRAVRAAGRFFYRRPAAWRLDMLGGMLLPAFSVIADPSVSVSPRGVAGAVASDQLRQLAGVADWLNGAALAVFTADDTVIVPGRNVRYRRGAVTVTLDGRDGTVREVMAPGYRIRFDTYAAYEGVFLPGRIRAALPQQELSAEVRVRSVTANEPVDDALPGRVGQTR